jgi:putative Holliday junction resolvase
VLGVDLGERRIGIALSDARRRVASPLRVLERGSSHEVDHREILGVARAEDATVVVVGLPRSLSGELGPAARAVLDEVEELRRAAGPDIAVEVYDERLTTVVAERALEEAGVSRRKQRAVVDKVAAAVMLQGYLESRA